MNPTPNEHPRAGWLLVTNKGDCTLSIVDPLFPASGPATRSFNGLHPKSNFLAFIFLAFIKSNFLALA